MAVIVAQQLGLREVEQDLDELALEALALAVEPFLARRVADRHALEKLALVEVGRRAQRLVVALRRQALELECIDLDHLGVQADRGAVDLQHQVGDVAERFADRAQRLAQRVTRLLVAAVAPQQIDQALARVAYPGSQGKESQQHFRLAHWQRNAPVGRQQTLEAAQQEEL